LQSIAPAVERRFAQHLQQQVLTQQSQHALTGWIVDLRHNTGGNAYPMLAGLQALLGDETCGYLVYPRRQAENAVHSQPIKKQRPQLPAAAPTPLRVAVLLDSLTGSSGELVAIAFKGLPNTRFFGQPSAGYTTATQHFKLSDGTYLVLTTGYMTDRHHVAYLTGIVPDVVVHTTPAHTPDSTLEAAKRWLLEAP
jgi:C-terminal processing protease CtpA/Prc